MTNIEKTLRLVVDNMYVDETGSREVEYEDGEEFATEDLLSLEKLETIIYNNIMSQEFVSTKGFRHDVETRHIRFFTAKEIKEIIHDEVAKEFQKVDGGQFAFPSVYDVEEEVETTISIDTLEKNWKNKSYSKEGKITIERTLALIRLQFGENEPAISQTIDMLKTECDNQFSRDSNAASYKYLFQYTDGNFSQAISNGCDTISQMAGYYLFNEILKA